MKFFCLTDANPYGNSKSYKKFKKQQTIQIFLFSKSKKIIIIINLHQGICIMSVYKYGSKVNFNHLAFSKKKY